MKILFIIGFVTGLAGCDRNTGSQKAEPLRVITINVNETEVGDAHLIITPSGKTMLIDAGMPGYGKSVILPFLKSRGIKRIDWMMASHMHDDHFGGMAEIISADDMEVGKIFWSSLPNILMEQRESMYASDSDKLMTAIRTACAAKHVALEEVEAGEVLNLGGGVRGRICAAAQADVNVPNYINNNSIIMQLEYRNFSMLFTGDAGFEEEDKVLSHGIDVHSDVLKIGHHAGAGSTGEQWVNAVRAKTGVATMPQWLSNDERGKRVYKQVTAAGMKMYRTWEHGNIEIQSYGDRFTILTQK